MLRLLRIVLLAGAIVVFLFHLPTVVLHLTMGADFMSELVAPGLEVSCTLGTQSFRQDPFDVDKQVERILSKQGIDGRVHVNSRKSERAADWGWIVDIKIPASPMDVDTAKRMANRISNAIAQEFPESEMIAYEYEGELPAREKFAVVYGPWVFAVTICILSLLAFWLLFRWRPGSPRGQDEQCAE